MKTKTVNTANLRKHFSPYLLAASIEPHLVTRDRWKDRTTPPAYAIPYTLWKRLVGDLPEDERPADLRLVNIYEGGTERDGVQCFNTRNARPALSEILNLAEEASQKMTRLGGVSRWGHTIVTRNRDTGEPVVFVPVVWLELLAGDAE